MVTANCGSRPVNSAPHQPTKRTKPAAKYSQYKTNRCGMVRMKRKKTVTRRCGAGSAAATRMGDGELRTGAGPGYAW